VADDGEHVKRIYLDQWVWINLAKAATGHRDGKHYEELLLMAREAVRLGHVSFPLFNTHYIETTHQKSHEKRGHLADVMKELSKFHSIAPQRVIIPAEIECALHGMFDIPGRPASAQVFGVGISHAFDTEIGTYRVPPEMGIEPAAAIVFEAQAQPLMEYQLLAGPPDHMMDGVESYDPNAHRVVPREFASHMEEHRLELLNGDWHKGDKGRRVALANAFANYYKPIDEALRCHRLTWDDLLQQGIDGMTSFIEAIPTGYADTELQRLRNEASQACWEPNDLNDLDALARAVVYCDAIVTEGQWVSFIDRAGLGTRYDTIALSKMDDLLPILVNAASD